MRTLIRRMKWDTGTYQSSMPKARRYAFMARVSARTDIRNLLRRRTSLPLSVTKDDEEVAVNAPSGPAGPTFLILVNVQSFARLSPG